MTSESASEKTANFRYTPISRLLFNSYNNVSSDLPMSEFRVNPTNVLFGENGDIECFSYVAIFIDYFLKHLLRLAKLAKLLIARSDIGFASKLYILSLIH